MITDVRFEDFIGIFDTEFDPTEFINFFEHCRECNIAFDRKGFESNGR